MKKQTKNLTPVKQFSLFVRKANQLSKLDCFNFLSNYESSISISWQEGSEATISNLIKPEENAYRSYLITFRQFLLSESNIQVNKILNIAVRQARHTALQNRLIVLKNDLKEINKYLRGITRQSEDGEIEISGYDLFNLWLNGTIFRHDVEADELFSTLGILKDLTEVNFTKFIGLYSNFIVHLSAVIESGLETNGFDLLNKLSPHFDAKFILEVSESDKAGVITFWESTRRFPQTLAICEIHDQDPVINVTDFDKSNENLKLTKVEIKSCCQNAAENALKRIHNSIAWINYLEKHGQPQENLIEIMEIPVTNINEAQIIKIALDDYQLIWRRKIGNMRCPVHHLPPGVRGFGIDLFMQGDGNQTNFVFLQGCCREFIREFF